MERKFTDDEIVKALECCKNANCCRCPFDGETDCVHECAEVTLDLINRQKAYIEKVKPIHNSFERELECAKQEAIKEFADRLKKEVDGWYYDFANIDDTMGALRDIDRLVKEMTGGRSGLQWQAKTR